MSILKLKIQDFREVETPRTGWIFLGYDTSGGTITNGALAQMDEFGNIIYIESGTTTGVNGTSGISGTSGKSGTSGTSSTSGTSGISIKGDIGLTGSGGTSGANGVFIGTNGTSGSSGKDGTDGTFYGTSGSSGIDGTSGKDGSGTSGSSGKNGYGSSGTSGQNGYDGWSDVNSFTWVISDPDVGGIPGPKIWNNSDGFFGYDGLRIDSYISGGTDLTFNIQNRSTDELLVSGTTVYTGLTTSLTLTSDSTEFWRNSTIYPNIPTLINDNWLWLEITNLTGSPDKLVITLFVVPFIYL